MTTSLLAVSRSNGVADMEIAIILFNDKERKIVEGLVHRMVKRAVEMEGTVTGEHGVGLIKRDYLNHELGQTTVDAMRKVRTPHATVIWRKRHDAYQANADETSVRSTVLAELR